MFVVVVCEAIAESCSVVYSIVSESTGALRDNLRKSVEAQVIVSEYLNGFSGSVKGDVTPPNPWPDAGVYGGSPHPL